MPVVFAAFQLIISEPMRALSSTIHCCKWSNYDFCISQGSVATVLSCNGQNYSHLRQGFSWCRVPKINKVGQCFTMLLKKVARFYDPRCIYRLNYMHVLCRNLRNKRSYTKKYKVQIKIIDYSVNWNNTKYLSGNRINKLATIHTVIG